MDSWNALKTECAACRACGLCEGRTNLVFGVGNEQADLMFIGEGPGEQEDLQGLPFVGPAGRFLDNMLEMIDLDRNTVYIANIVKCRPPHNRDPQTQEMLSCRPWLDRQIALVDPKLIVCLGRIAATAVRPHGTGVDAVAEVIHPRCFVTRPNVRTRLWICGKSERSTEPYPKAATNEFFDFQNRHTV